MNILSNIQCLRKALNLHCCTCCNMKVWILCGWSTYKVKLCWFQTNCVPISWPMLITQTPLPQKAIFCLISWNIWKFFFFLIVQFCERHSPFAQRGGASTDQRGQVQLHRCSVGLQESKVKQNIFTFISHSEKFRHLMNILSNIKLWNIK
jgi:hypothetical protein